MTSYTKARQRYETQNTEPDDGVPEVPLAQCMAKGCPMAAALSLGGPKRKVQWCAYHHTCPVDDLARVTSVLNQHQDLRNVINDGRRMIAQEGADVSQHAGEWKRSIELLKFGGYSQIPKGHDFANFLYLCECMLGQFVIEAMRSRRRAA